MATVRITEIVRFLETIYPPSTAESWDRVGLTVGNADREARRVLLAVDPVPEVIEEAVEGEYDLLVTHHPLYLRGTSFITEDDPKGRMVAELIRSGCALYCAHTNADVNRGGVAEALGRLFGLKDMVPLVAAEDSETGAGRIGTVQPQTLGDFAGLVAGALPAGPTGILVGGNLDAVVETVAVSGGAGDSFLEAARRADADVFVTADLRHHPSSEHLMGGAPALICGSHWATEWPWLPLLAEQLRDAFPGRIEVHVSTLVTEPWAMHLDTKGPAS